MDTIWSNVWDFGRPTSYHQAFSMNYQVPLNKIPLVNFISLNTRYNSSYDWASAPLALKYLGHTIQNSNAKQYNGQINMNTLYNKVPYFKKINQGRGSRAKANKNSKNDKKNKDDEDAAEKKKKYEIFKHLTRFALGVKNISINYSESK